MFSNLPDGIVQMLQRLTANGFQAYLVGGCVRDEVLGRIPHDYDITTNAKPDEIITLFGSENCTAYGRAFGTVGVAYAHSFAEITTYRTETEYTDYRHPHQVYFAKDIMEDLARRDFTCNAMAWHLETGLLDPFGGTQDLHHKILRCVGVPSARFREDALRILRAMRFSAKLDLMPEVYTHAAMQAGAFLLTHISAERIFSELCNMLMGNSITRVLMAYPEILAVRIPEILPCIEFSQHSRFHDFTVWEHMARAVGNAPPNLTVRMTMLLHDIAKPACYTQDAAGGHFKTHAQKSAAMADKILFRLKSSNAFREQVCRLIAYHRQIPADMPAVRTLLGIMGDAEYAMLIQVLQADRISKLLENPESDGRIRKAEMLAQQCREQNLCCQLKDLQINGNDVIKAGFSGKQIRQALHFALQEVLYERCPNQKEALLALLAFCSSES